MQGFLKFDKFYSKKNAKYCISNEGAKLSNLSKKTPKIKKRLFVTS